MLLPCWSFHPISPSLALPLGLGQRQAPHEPQNCISQEKTLGASGVGPRAAQGAADQCLFVHFRPPALTPHLPWNPATLPAAAGAHHGPDAHSPASPGSGAHAPPTAASPKSGLPCQAAAGSGLCARCPASSGASLGRSARFRWPTATGHGFAGQWRPLVGLGCSAGAETGPALTSLGHLSS